MSRVAVNEAVLRWALQRSGITPLDIQDKFPIREWLSGEKKPTLRQLEKFAKTTLTPLGFLFLKQPPKQELPMPHFRTVADEEPSDPSPDLVDSVHAMQRRQFWMREFLIEQGQEPLPFVGSATRDESTSSTAQRMRETLGFDHGWAAQVRTWAEALRTFREAMEDASILVVVNGVVENNTSRKLAPEEFRGFVLVDEYAPLAFVNGADAKSAQMFTLAHELAHIFFGKSAAFDLRYMQPADDPMEKACNSVAAEFLVPRHELLQLWPSVSDDPDPFNRIARAFKVSAIVAARRALDLQLIDWSQFMSFYHERPSEWPTTSSDERSGDFYNNQNVRVGRRFFSAINQAAKEGKLLYSEAYQLTGLYGKTFDVYASRPYSEPM